MFLGVVPFVGPAQGQNGENGLRLDLSVSERIEARRSDTSKDQVTANTGLNFSARSSTRTQTLTFGASTSLRLGDSTAEFGARRARLSYQLRGKDAQLRASGDYARENIEFLRPAELILNDEGELQVPTDVSDLTGTGLRERNSLDFSLSLLRTAPFGLDITASRTALNYRDVVSDRLRDSVRSRLNLSARFDLSTALTLNTQIGQTWVATEAQPDKQTLTYGASLSTNTRIARVGLSFDAAREDAGTRSSTSLFWSQDLPGGQQFSLNLGLTQAIAGNEVIKASAAYTRALRNGSLRARYDRQVTDQTDGNEATVSALSLQYATELSPVTDLSLGATMVATEQLGTAEAEILDRSVSVGLRHALSEDWTLGLNLGLDQRRQSGTATTRSERVSFSITRNFSANY